MNLQTKISAFTAAGGNGKARFRGRLLFVLAAVSILLLAFVITFIVCFPVQPLRARLERMAWRDGGQKVTIGGLSFAAPLGLRFTRIGWQPPDPKWPMITVASAHLSPLWTTLFTGDPGVALQAGLSSGTLRGRLTKDGNFEATLAGIVLRPLLPTGFAHLSGGIVSGRIQGTQMLLPGSRRVTFELAIKHLSVGGFKSLGASRDRLSLGRMSLSGELRGNTLDIKDVSSSNGDLRLKGKAVVLLGNSLAQCRVTANIKLTPGPGLDLTLRGLLPLTGAKPDRQGAYRFRIGGSLARPVLH